MAKKVLINYQQSERGNNYIYLVIEHDDHTRTGLMLETVNSCPNF